MNPTATARLLATGHELNGFDEIGHLIGTVIIEFGCVAAVALVYRLLVGGKSRRGDDDR